MKTACFGKVVTASLDGAKTFANLMSVIKTAIKQNISPYTAVRAIFNGNPCLA